MEHNGTTPEVVRQLDELAQVKAEMAAKAHELDEQILALQEERAGLIAEEKARAEELEAAIRAEVLRTGATVKGAALMAVFASPRVTWDSKALDGFAAAHPEIAAFRKTGEPSVSFREVKR